MPSTCRDTPIPAVLIEFNGKETRARKGPFSADLPV